MSLDLQKSNVDAGSARLRGAHASAASGSAVIQFINFALGADNYGIDIMAVREIKEWSDITALPNQPQYVRGVLDLRGVIVPIIDLRCRLGQGITDATPLHVVIIVQIDTHLTGLLADRVSDIVSIDPARIKQVPKVVQSACVDFLSGILTLDGMMIALIDLPTLLLKREGAASILPANIQ